MLSGQYGPVNARSGEHVPAGSLPTGRRPCAISPMFGALSEQPGEYGPRLPAALVRSDVLPLAGVGAGDDGDDRLGVAEGEDLVGDAGPDEDEGAGLGLDRPGQSGAV